MVLHTPFRLFAGSALAMILTACGPTSRAHWTSQGATSSPFSATVSEDTYNSGDSIIYTLRFEKKEDRPGEGWFVKKKLDGDSARPHRPNLIWTTPKDLTVIVHTDRITGHVVQIFGNKPGNDGSLTFDYRADGLEQ
jgi:hypothetical protein